MGVHLFDINVRIAIKHSEQAGAVWMHNMHIKKTTTLYCLSTIQQPSTVPDLTEWRADPNTWSDHGTILISVSLLQVSTLRSFVVILAQHDILCTQVTIFARTLETPLV